MVFSAPRKRHDGAPNGCFIPAPCQPPVLLMLHCGCACRLPVSWARSLKRARHVSHALSLPDISREHRAVCLFYSLSLGGPKDQARERHININCWSGCPCNDPGIVPGTNPGFLLILHHGSPVCSRDKPSLSLGQGRGRRVAEKNYVLKVDWPFSVSKRNQNYFERGWGG